MSATLESARREWEAGHRRLEDVTRDPARRERLLAQVEAVTDELRKRIGATFTLAELADEYAGADRWTRPAVADRAGDSREWPATLSLVEDSAFHLYQRGALDYRP